MTTRVAYLLSQYPEFHETFIAREIEALIQRGISVQIFSLKKPPAEGQDLYPSHRQFIRYLPFFLSGRVWLDNAGELFVHPARYVRALSGIISTYIKRPVELIKALAVFPKTVSYAREIRRSDAVLHAHWISVPTTMAMVIKTLSGTTVSATAHAWDIFLTPKNELNQKLAQLSGAVTCTAYNVEHLKALCQPQDSQKIFLNYHGLDFTTIDSLIARKNETESLELIAIGRLVEQKGFIHAIRALHLLDNIRLPVHLKIIGEGPLHNELLAATTGLPRHIRVTFSGRLSHLETLQTLQNSDVMLAPSVLASDGDRDGIPNVILEGMACRLPIIGTNVSGIPEVVNEQTGWLVASEQPEALAAAIRLAIQEKNSLSEKGANGREWVEQYFDMHRNVDEFLDYLMQFHQRSVSSK